MRLIFASLLLSALPLWAGAQTLTTRPGSTTQGAILLPAQPVLPAPQQAPAPQPQDQSMASVLVDPPGTPVIRGQFRPIAIRPPSIERLFPTKTIPLGIQDTAALGATQWPYAVYTPGGPQTRTSDGLVVFLPPGLKPADAVRAMDLRKTARARNMHYLLVPTPQTPRPQSATLSELAQAQDAREEDSERIDRVLATILAQESLRPTAVIASEGAGDALLGLLCTRSPRAPRPTQAVVMGGAIDAQTAAACRPRGVPKLLIMRSTADTSTPYGGGEQATVPGQTQTPASSVLSAAGTRGLWAMLAGCQDTTPTLAWTTLGGARTAIETHGACRQGGPVGLLSTLGGAGLPTGDSLTTVIDAFLQGDLL